MPRFLCVLGLSCFLVACASACGDDGGSSDTAAADTSRRDTASGCGTTGCPDGLECCGGIAGAFCREIARDPENCGGCGVSCGVRESCTAGVCVEDDAGVDACVPECGAGARCCARACIPRDGSGVDPTFRREDSSFFNCGGCDMACEAISTSECMSLTAGADPQCLCGGVLPCEPPTSCVLLAGGWSCAAP